MSVGTSLWLAVEAVGPGLVATLTVLVDPETPLPEHAAAWVKWAMLGLMIRWLVAAPSRKSGR